MSAGGGDRDGGRRPLFLRRGTALLMTALTLSLGGGSGAKATTGALELVHPPRVIVPFARASKFQGRYVLRRVGAGADIRSGGMKIEFSPGSAPQYLIGAAQLYRYDEAGRIETALFTLFPFRETPMGVTATLLKHGIGGPDRTPPQGTIELEKPAADGRVEGTIELHGDGPYAVVFSALAAGAEGYGQSPPARQLREAKRSEAGWSADPRTSQGEYELADPAPDVSTGSGSLALLVSLTHQLGRGVERPTGGDLAVLRGEPSIGEVSLRFGSFEKTFYLTDLSRSGERRLATVRGGSPTGPEVGRFTGTQGAEVLKGTLTAGRSRYPVAFRKEDD